MITGRAVVVTGASTGIGRTIAIKAAAEGAHVFASVRKAADGERLKAELGAKVTPLLFDIADEAAVRAGAAEVAAALGARTLFGLVNNAGIAVAGPLLYLDASELRRQLEINLIGTHIVTQAFAPLLGADAERAGPKGRIVMMSSVGGLNGSPFVGPYNSSKFALEGYSQSLRRELMLFGIDVVVVGPGAINTPIWEKSDHEDYARFENGPYRDMIAATRAHMNKIGREGLPPEDVANVVWRALTLPKPKTRYAVVKNPLMDSFLPRALPPRWVDRIIAGRLGLKR